MVDGFHGNAMQFCAAKQTGSSGNEQHDEHCQLQFIHTLLNAVWFSFEHSSDLHKTLPKKCVLEDSLHFSFQHKIFSSAKKMILNHVWQIFKQVMGQFKGARHE